MGIIENAYGNGKVIWQNINKVLGCQGKQDKGLELCIKNTPVKDPLTLATSLNHFFLESVNDIVQQLSSPECVYSPVDHTRPTFNFIDITESEVAKGPGMSLG